MHTLKLERLINVDGSSITPHYRHALHFAIEEELRVFFQWVSLTIRPRISLVVARGQ